MTRTINKIRKINRQWKAIVSVVVSYGKPFIGLFWAGVGMAFLIVAVRVTLPWCFKWVIDNWLSGNQTSTPQWIENLGIGFSVGIFFLILVVILGFADYAARLYFARYSIGAVRNMRSDAFRKYKNAGEEEMNINQGDLISRLISDAARMKAGLKGFLIHVATNGFLLLTVCMILLMTDLLQGSFFIAGLIVILIVTYFYAGIIYRKALRYRDKEGQLAEAITNTVNVPTAHQYANSINDSSGRHEASLTRLQGQATWIAHGVFGVVVMLTLVTGLNRVASGHISNGDLVLFLLYALTIRGPFIQLTRQGTRTGKIFACGHRILQLINKARKADKKTPDPDWESIRLSKVKVYSTKIRGVKRRLGSIRVEFSRGERILVVGKKRAGKTTLLEVLANTLKPVSGKRYWGKDLYDKLNKTELNEKICYVEEDPHWSRIPFNKLLGKESQGIGSVETEILSELGLRALIEGLPKGFDSKFSSDHFSANERRRICLAIAALGNYELILLDNPFTGVSRKRMRKLMDTLHKINPGSTIVVTASKPVIEENFDRVLYLEKGRIVSFNDEEETDPGNHSETQNSNFLPA